MSSFEECQERGLNSLRRKLELDEVCAKRGKPSMPKLAFMNGTKWGKDPDADVEPSPWAA